MSVTESTKSIRLWIHGITGRMGQAITASLDHRRTEFQLLGGSGQSFVSETFNLGRTVTPQSLATILGRDHPDVIIDFSTASGNKTLYQALEICNLPKLAVVIGTTGLEDQTLRLWARLGKEKNISILYAPNTSVGVLLTLQAALQIVKPLRNLGFDIELVESHHNAKKDSPSGTALFLAKALAKTEQLQIVHDRPGKREPNEIGVHAIRGGGIIGEHEIRFIGADQEIKISHRAFNRNLFAEGALILSRWLTLKSCEFYELQDVDLSSISN